MPTTDALITYPLLDARAVVGAPVFKRLPNGVGVIEANLGLDPARLAADKAAGRVYPNYHSYILVVRWANGQREQVLSTAVGDYDRYLSIEDQKHAARLTRRARLGVTLPLNRP